MSRVLVDSGIKWIGEYPDEWNLFPLRAVVENINEKNNPIKFTNVLSLTNKLGVVPYEEKGNQGNISKEDISQYKIAYKDTVIINSMNLKIGSVGYSNYDGCVSPVYYVLKNNKKSDIRFINYIFQSNFQKYLSKYGKGILEIREKISMYDVLHSYVPIPSLKEQKRIVDYLDEQCTKIDEIINDNNHEIELLEEYKMKILDTACLKGVDKHEFINISHYSIDKIPAGWKFQKTLGILNMPITDGPHSTPNLINDGIPFISADAIKDGKIDFSRKRGDISEEDYLEFSKKYIPKLHDIYMIKSGATTGKVGIVETTEKFTIWSPLAVYRVDEKKMNYKYLYYLLQTNFYQKQVQLSWSYGTQQNIGMRILEKLKVLVPPLSEQEKIVKEIDNKFDKLNKSIDYRKQIIEKLEEYKKSLIYECVTGKREV